MAQQLMIIRIVRCLDTLIQIQLSIHILLHFKIQSNTSKLIVVIIAKTEVRYKKTVAVFKIFTITYDSYSLAC